MIQFKRAQSIQTYTDYKTIPNRGHRWYYLSLYFMLQSVKPRSCEISINDVSSLVFGPCLYGNPHNTIRCILAKAVGNMFRIVLLSKFVAAIESEENQHKIMCFHAVSTTPSTVCTMRVFDLLCWDAFFSLMQCCLKIFQVKAMAKRLCSPQLHLRPRSF